MDRSTFRSGKTPNKNSKNRGLGFCLLFLIAVSSLTSKEVIQKREISLHLWKKENVKLESILGKKSVLQPTERIPREGFLFLDFEAEETFPNLLKILTNSYISDTKHSLIGKRSGFFSGKRNQIQVSLEGSKLFPRVKEIFTIRMPILLNEQGSSSTLLEKTVLIKGRLYGFSLELEENKPIVNVHNLFIMEDGSTRSAKILSSEAVPRKEWHSLSVTFDPLEKKVLLYQNGKLRGYTQLETEDVADLSFPLQDSTPLVIAKNYYGNADAIHIHKGYPWKESTYTRYQAAELEEETNIPSHQGSFLTSPVLTSHYSQSVLDSWTVGSEKPQETLTNLYFRGSNEKFSDESSNAPQWIRLEKEAPKIRFKYHQWKVWLRPSPKGDKVPLVHSFQYSLREQLPPETPFGLRIFADPKEEKKVCLVWSSNHEREVQEGGGYLIHYGVHPNQMVSTLFMKPGQEPEPITGKEIDSNYRNLKFCVTEETLVANSYLPEEKKGQAKPGMRDSIFLGDREKNPLLFHPGITYYFRISAYNRYYDEWQGRDQKSPVTEPVSISFPQEIGQR